MVFGVHELWSFLLIFARVTALCVSAPVFGYHGIPQQTKIGLAALLSFILMPVVGRNVGAYPVDMLALTTRLAAEVAIGLALGYLVVIVFSGLQLAGSFIDNQMGFGMINTLNPYSQQQGSVMSQFLYQLGLTLFLIGGGHLYLINTLANSYGIVPPGGAHFSGDISGAVMVFAGNMFLLAFKIAAPAAAVLLVVDVAFAIVARTVPQMNVYIVGMPAKVVVGLTTVALVLPAMAVVITQMVGSVGATANTLFQAVR